MKVFKNYRSKIKKILNKYGFGPGKKTNLNDYLSKYNNLDKLHLGCGNIYIKGWVNVDVLQTGATDIVMDIKKLPGIKHNSVKEIYACHVLEHFSTKEVIEILRRWNQVLIPGGKLRISVPDLDAITRIYQKNIKHFQTPGNQPWVALIYGGQKDEYDFHKTGFNECWLKYILEKNDYEKAERYENNPHFIGDMIDNSLANLPFGEYISLNMLCYKKVY